MVQGLIAEIGPVPYELGDQVRAALALGTDTGPQIGTVLLFPPGVPAQPGWIDCDGRALSQEEYPALFKIVGNSYGDAPIRHFLLPDLGPSNWRIKGK